VPVLPGIAAFPLVTLLLLGLRVVGARSLKLFRGSELLMILAVNGLWLLSAFVFLAAGRRPRGRRTGSCAT
jgi:hypothetical protein